MVVGAGCDLTVLHVDDDEALADVATEYLQRDLEDATILTASDGSTALSVLEDEPGIDVVVSDYQMPEMDGLELFESVRERRPDVPFVLFTGKGSEEIASEAISAGVTDYLQKETGTDHYTVLANRIERAVAEYRAERTLERTRRRYRTLITETVDVVAIVDADGGIEFVSPAAERILGYDPATLRDRSVFEHVHPDDRDEAAAALQTLLAEPSGTRSIEVRFERGDGEWIRLEVRGRDLLDEPAIEGVVVHARDVTDRWERQRDLEQYERIVEVGGDGAYVLDEEGRYEMVNGRTLERTGYDREELLGTHGSIVFDEADVERARQALLRVFRTDDEDFAQFEATVHAKDGTEYPVEIRTAPIVEDGRIAGSVGISRDIPERKARERELERYERLVETMADAAQITDAEGRFVTVNRRLLEVTGYEREELLGRTPRVIVADEDYRRSTEALRAVLRDPDREFAELQLTIEPKSGDPFPVRTRIAPMTDDDGEFVGTVGVTRAVSESPGSATTFGRRAEGLE